MVHPGPRLADAVLARDSLELTFDAPLSDAFDASASRVTTRRAAQLESGRGVVTLTEASALSEDRRTLRFFTSRLPIADELWTVVLGYQNGEAEVARVQGLEAAPSVEALPIAPQ